VVSSNALDGSISFSSSVEKLNVSSETILLNKASNGFVASLNVGAFFKAESTSDVNSFGASSASSKSSTSSGPESLIKLLAFFSFSE